MSALRKMLLKRGIRQKNVAAALRISKAAVSLQVKRGIRSVATARRYAELLKCDAFFLLD